MTTAVLNEDGKIPEQRDSLMIHVSGKVRENVIKTMIKKRCRKGIKVTRFDSGLLNLLLLLDRHF